MGGFNVSRCIKAPTECNKRECNKCAVLSYHVALYTTV